tara:strand:+ start:377 stop:652 length:276 start_codon:yes stop_codon:yes gene_type:complete
MHIQTGVLTMNRTPLRQSEYETSLAVSAARTPIIDSAVATLQVQMEEVIARQARFDRGIEELHTALQALLRDLSKFRLLRDLDEVEESADE